MQKLQEEALPSLVERLKPIVSKDLYQDFSLRSGISALQLTLHSILAPEQVGPAIQSYIFNWEKDARRKFAAQRETLLAQFQGQIDEAEITRAQEAALYEVRDILKKALQEKPGFLSS